MKVIIAGSRTLFPSASQIDKALKDWNVTEVVSGTAQGVDTAGELYAAQAKIPVKRFPANWKLYGKRAGFLRNAEMAKYADCLLAFWDGSSPGTKSMIELMKDKPTIFGKAT